MADQAELAFVKSHLNTLGSLPVQYPNDHRQPPQNTLKRIPILPIDLPPPPTPKAPLDSSPSGSISITFKSIKPPRAFTLPSVNPTDSIAMLKAQLATQPGAPPPDAQRLLLRGKALADGKLLKEYDAKDGDSFTVMVKPGFQWDWNTSAPAPPAAVAATQPPAPAPTLAAAQSTDADGDVQMKLEPDVSAMKRKGSHTRIPSVVLSPSPSISDSPMLGTPTSIHLTLDTSGIPTASELAEGDAFQRKMSSPAFWQRLHAFLTAQFDTTDDANRAFESFLLGSKGYLSANDIAKIRDSVGVMGMGGN
ncbi:hypothetical protein BD410DRAFT_193638 [Rickenella mellea]|uniref:Ubiquitin-like domain-containing protein n=1 Tax=Rickenella mellea TaxID=50990 RepID=A0A4Y7Q781_9AGAM|nr:hypothetical protein BD410DRAFT_193638 [Rickenella mellea]